MKHNLGDLLELVYRYYPRRVGIADDVDEQLRHKTEEHARLVAARIQASKDERWHAMRRRIGERFPGMLTDQSLHLHGGGCAACYSFTINLSKFAGRTLWFEVSFLAPYYIIHSPRTIEMVKELRDDFSTSFRGMLFIVPRSPLEPRLISNPDHGRPRTIAITRQYVTFDLSPDEQPYATGSPTRSKRPLVASACRQMSEPCSCQMWRRLCGFREKSGSTTACFRITTHG